MADNTQDPFAATGGGVQLANGAWVPKDHPLAQQQAASGTTSGSTSGTTQQSQSSYAPQAPTSGGVNATDALKNQASNAQTYSTTPGAAPTQQTANQGTQDVVRNEWLQQATQGTQIDPNDPNIKQQVDPYAAAQERARRQYISEAAERNSAQGLGNSGAMDQERRYAAEQAGQATGQFQAGLIGQELQNRRSEIQNALTNLAGVISNDQKNALTKQLADLDAAIKREGLAQTGELGSQDNSIKEKLGTGQLNLGLMQALLQNQQFNTGQALDWSKFDWQTSPFNPANM